MYKKDSQGRQFIAHHDVRSALVSATASLTTGTAATLLAGDSDYLLDMVEVTFANNSTVGATVALVSDGTTIKTVVAPANGTAQLHFYAPLRQSTKNTPWIADMEDITGTTVTIDAVFIKKSSN